MASLVPLLGALKRTFGQAARTDGPLRHEIEPFAVLVDTLDAAGAEPPAKTNIDYEPVLMELIACAARGGMADMALAIEKAAPLLNWTYRFGEAEWHRTHDPVFANGSLAGPIGVIRRQDFLLDVLALGADIMFPPHGHEAIELSYVISGWPTVRSGDMPARTYPPGSFIFHASNTPHVTWSGPDGVLALIVWRGDLDAPMWRTTTTAPLPRLQSAAKPVSREP